MNNLPNIGNQNCCLWITSSISWILSNSWSNHVTIFLSICIDLSARLSILPFWCIDCPFGILSNEKKWHLLSLLGGYTRCGKEIHPCTTCTRLLEYMEMANVCIVQWPTNSTDFHRPITLLWHCLDCCFYSIEYPQHTLSQDLCSQHGSKYLQ